MNKLIKIFFISIIYSISTGKTVLAMQKIDTLEKIYAYIFKTHTEELLSLVEDGMDFDSSKLLENLLADLLQSRKIFPDGKSKFPNQKIAVLLLSSNLFIYLNLPDTFWQDEIETFANHFLPPDDGAVIEILTKLKSKLPASLLISK